MCQSDFFCLSMSHTIPQPFSPRTKQVCMARLFACTHNKIKTFTQGSSIQLPFLCFSVTSLVAPTLFHCPFQGPDLFLTIVLFTVFPLFVIHLNFLFVFGVIFIVVRQVLFFYSEDKMPPSLTSSFLLLHFSFATSAQFPAPCD